jgi:hypothetical protein
MTAPQPTKDQIIESARAVNTFLETEHGRTAIEACRLMLVRRFLTPNLTPEQVAAYYAEVQGFERVQTALESMVGAGVFAAQTPKL